MDAQLFKKLVKEIKVGKKLPDAIYLHKDAFDELPNTLNGFIPAVAKALNITEDDWNLVKLFKKSFVYHYFTIPIFTNTPTPHKKKY